jgi:predicted DCC family thiol-disulfide oxidoreductase YuxK
VRDAGTARESVLSRSSAVLFALSELGFPWRALSFLAIVPRAVRDVLYDGIARSRYRIFGRYEQCAMAPAGFERRFLDVGEGATTAPEPTREQAAVATT